jgi:hypothetical protein
MHVLLGAAQLAVGEQVLDPPSFPLSPPSPAPPLSTVFPLSVLARLPSLVPASLGPALLLLELLHPTAKTIAPTTNPPPTTLDIEIENCM